MGVIGRNPLRQSQFHGKLGARDNIYWRDDDLFYYSECSWERPSALKNTFLEGVGWVLSNSWTLKYRVSGSIRYNTLSDYYCVRHRSQRRCTTKQTDLEKQFQGIVWAQHLPGPYSTPSISKYLSKPMQSSHWPHGVCYKRLANIGT